VEDKRKEGMRMARQFLGMELSTEQQLGYLFEQFTDDSEENPGRIVAIERALEEIRRHLTHSGEQTWSRFLYDVGKGISVVVGPSLVLALLTLIALGLRVQFAAAGAP
jgi:hypothetical protein